jgi:hypothetical protein
MSWIHDLRGYGRFAFGMRRYLSRPETIESAAARIRRNLRAREANFTTLLERAVFDHAKSPYLPLFRNAHCGLADVRAMLRDRGLEPTLTALRDAGVYVAFEEFKGRRPIVRDGREYPVRAGDFDNPLTPWPVRAHSGGSTGVPTRVIQDLEFLEERAAHYVFTLGAHDILEAPAAMWRGVLPDGSGLNVALILARGGRPPVRWFTPTGHGPLRDLRLVKFRIAHVATILMARAAGARIPWPELVDVEDAGRVAEWMGETLRAHGTCAAFMVVSRAVRVAVAAAERGLDLTGATFVAAGEPATPAKMSIIRSSGAACMTTYGMVEAGRVGMGCRGAADPSDVHVMTDVCSVIASPTTLAVGNAVLSPLSLTVVMPSSSKVMINTEIDDCGILETRPCACPIGRLGLTTHLRNIRSVGKLTTEGVSMLGSEMTHILEEVLPARFGGTALDYQLLEEEDATGLTRLSLLVHPDIPVADESRVVEAVLDAMSRASLGSEAARQVWSRTNTLRVRRLRPLLTAHGKMKPVHKARRTTDASALAGR